MALNKDEVARYKRQIMVPSIGEEGQVKLKEAHIVIAGVGGLGCASAYYLAAAGMGHITLVDYDTVELSDLNRQILYTSDDIGQKKVMLAQNRLLKLNPMINITAVDESINENNVSTIINNAEIVVDGLDNMETRLILNAACIKLDKPCVFGGVSRLRGIVTTVIPKITPCLACIYNEGIGNLGVLGMVPAIIANLQAMEAIKLVLGQKPLLAGRLLTFNGDDMKFSIYEIERNTSCRVCCAM